MTVNPNYPPFETWQKIQEIKRDPRAFFKKLDEMFKSVTKALKELANMLIELFERVWSFLNDWDPNIRTAIATPMTVSRPPRTVYPTRRHKWN